MLMLSVQSVLGQNILYEIPDINVKSSIIRYFEGEKSYVIYTDDDVSRKFVYFDPATGTAVSADFTSADVIVNDMKIVNKSLYFCGKQAQSDKAAFGRFDIHSVFFGTDRIHIMYCTAYPIYHPYISNLAEQLTNLLQIEVQEISATDVHIYMTADAYNMDANNTVSSSYRCVVDVSDNGSSGVAWTHEEFLGDYYFNDLVITDTSLVVVGDKHGATGQYMHRYTLPTTASTSALSTAPLAMPYWFAHDNQYFPQSEVRLAHIAGSAFAVACYGVVQSDLKGIVVSVYNGPGNLIDRILIKDPYDTKQIRDLECKYDEEKGQLYLVPEHTQTTKTNSQYLIDLSPSLTMTGVSLLTPLLDDAHSLTINDHMTEVSGRHGESLWVWRTDIPSSDCATGENIPFNHFWFPEGHYVQNIFPNFWNYQYTDIKPLISNHNTSIQCK